MTTVSRIARFSLTTANAPALAAFYQDVFGCAWISTDRQDGTAFEEMMGVPGGASRIKLALGDEIIELIEFDQAGAPYPAAAAASDLCFQHFAIVVPDMARAWQRLCALKGWSAITTGAPQKLPVASGGVTAFKFRDPEGHPLEFLTFPREKTPAKWQCTAPNALCQGIDHSAISIANSDNSGQFYGALGFTKLTCTENQGDGQDALDGLEETHVEVTALQTVDPTPHIELLAYQDGTNRLHKSVEPHDIACTRLIFESADAQPQSLMDPDGHRMIIVPHDHNQSHSSQ
jgi:catechol 2,3-dioxygenase-like lactoylglutathione lyase family enzyme